MPDEYFVDLISNASMEIYPNNTLSEFINRLPQKLELDGEWLVALHEIIYPLSTKPMKRTIRYRLPINNEKIASPTRYFTYTENAKIDEILMAFNEEIKKVYEEENTYDDRTYNPPHFATTIVKEGDKEKTKVILHIGSIPGSIRAIHPFMEDPFVRLIGFEVGSFYKEIDSAHRRKETEIISPYQPDTSVKSNLVFINSDVVKEHYVGDVFARVLRVIPHNKNTGDLLDHITFNTPYYYPVRMNQVEDISIKITDEMGHKIKFKHGRVFLSLHFKRKTV